MKKFSFSCPKIVFILLVCLTLISVGGIIWNIFNIYSLTLGTVKIIGQILAIAVNTAFVVLSLGALLCHRYKVGTKYIYLNFGLIRIKYKTEDVIMISYFNKSDKLVLNFKDGKYTVICIDNTLYDDFIKAVREINDKIIYDKNNET